MDTGYLKAFVICGAACCIGPIVRYSPRRFFHSSPPIQGAIATGIGTQAASQACSWGTAWREDIP
jgi:hypothetical protein